jgi:glutamate formiminotransferase
LSRALVECVPNFSEGRNRSTVDAIVNAIAAVPGVSLLAHECDFDHNRAVVTFAGPPEQVSEAALRGIGEAVKHIDLRQHSGVHPRIGAADVVPFVPIDDITLEECAALAVRTAEELWRRLKVPVYLYEAAARLPERRRLENLRRGGLEYLKANVAERPPDIGGPNLHPTAGATVMGARKLLIAFNINLTTADVAVAHAIARKVRQSSGGLPHVKALGLAINSRGFAQVSLNLTDFEVTGLHEVFEAVRLEAARHGTAIATSEIIGLVPRRALEAAAAAFLQVQNFSPERVLERRIDQTARVNGQE